MVLKRLSRRPSINRKPPRLIDVDRNSSKSSGLPRAQAGFGKGSPYLANLPEGSQSFIAIGIGDVAGEVFDDCANPKLEAAFPVNV
jgi:hypothetical protein